MKNKFILDPSIIYAASYMIRVGILKKKQYYHFKKLEKKNPQSEKKKYKR